MNKAALASILLLAGCHGAANDGQAGQAGSNRTEAAPAAPAQAADDGRVDCAIGGEADFRRVCTIERTDRPDGRLLTIRAPDGGFRRLRVTRDGRGVVAADGAEAARVTIVAPDRIEVALGGDRYRLPATVRR